MKSSTLLLLVAALPLGALGCASETVVQSELEPYFVETNGWPVEGYSSIPEADRAFRVVLFLSQDQSATVYYEEGFLGHGFNQAPEWADTKTRLDGSWERRADGTYAVAGLLNCTFDIYFENEHLACTLEHDVASTGASGVAARVFPNQPGSKVGDTTDDPFYDDFTPRDLGR